METLNEKQAICLHFQRLRGKSVFEKIAVAAMIARINSDWSNYRLLLDAAADEIEALRKALEVKP